MSDCVPSNMIFTDDPTKKEEILEWCLKNKISIRCLAVVVDPRTFVPSIQWELDGDKDKTIFKLKWG